MMPFDSASQRPPPEPETGATSAAQLCYGKLSKANNMWVCIEKHTRHPTKGFLFTFLPLRRSLGSLPMSTSMTSINSPQQVPTWGKSPRQPHGEYWSNAPIRSNASTPNYDSGLHPQLRFWTRLASSRTFFSKVGLGWVWRVQSYPEEVLGDVGGWKFTGHLWIVQCIVLKRSPGSNQWVVFGGFRCSVS